MTDSTPRPPVRTRRRIIPHPQAAEATPFTKRIVADARAPTAKKRQPNSGSFRKGEPSRNPKGRPKGAKGKKSVVRKVLLEPVTVRLPGGPRKLTVFEALLLRERDLAFSGDWRARKTLIELGRWALPDDVLEDAGVAPATDPETDRAIVEWFEEEVRQQERQKKDAEK